MRAYVEKTKGDLPSLYWKDVKFVGETSLNFEYKIRDRLVLFNKKSKRFICTGNKDCLLMSSAKEFWNCWHVKTVSRAIRERKSWTWKNE